MGWRRLGAGSTALKDLRRLCRRPALRRDRGAIIVEGPLLLAELLDSEVVAQAVYADDAVHEELLQRADRAGASVAIVDRGVLDRIGDTVTSQGVITVAERPAPAVSDVAGRSGPVVVAVDLGDPGNTGTIIRSAAASGAGGVVVVGGADPFSPKAVRASAGAAFRCVPAIGADLSSVLAEITDAGRRTVAAVGRGGAPPETIDLTSPAALLIGSERTGLPTEVAERADDRVSIPMAADIESLNAAMAASVLLFEAARQRRSARA